MNNDIKLVLSNHFLLRFRSRFDDIVDPTLPYMAYKKAVMEFIKNDIKGCKMITFDNANVKQKKQYYTKESDKNVVVFMGVYARYICTRVKNDSILLITCYNHYKYCRIEDKPDTMRKTQSNGNIS
jgi:hypothetical protein